MVFQVCSETHGTSTLLKLSRFRSDQCLDGSRMNLGSPWMSPSIPGRNKYEELAFWIVTLAYHQLVWQQFLFTSTGEVSFNLRATHKDRGYFPHFYPKKCLIPLPFANIPSPCQPIEYYDDAFLPHWNEIAQMTYHYSAGMVWDKVDNTNQRPTPLTSVSQLSIGRHNVWFIIAL